MIRTELLNNGTLIRHWSDAGVMLLQVETGEKYSEAIDIFPCRYTYEETGELVESDDTENSELEEKAHAYDIIVGAEE